MRNAIVLKAPKNKPAGRVFLLIIGLWSINSMVKDFEYRSLTANEEATHEKSHYVEQTEPSEEPPVVADNGSEITIEDHLYQPNIDIISIGSITKQEYQEAQQRTFGAHPLVRTFFTVNELNDTDATCHTNFSKELLQKVVTFCDSMEGQTRESMMLRKRLFSPKRDTGWMCAQKRPIDGIRAALDHYKIHPLPSYLLVIDDDSYVNVDSLKETITKAYPVTESHVAGGCVYWYPRKLGFRFPVGGFGSILTRAAIERLMKPIYCESEKPDEFTKFACWRLDLNHVGEKQYFKEGMSVGDLMYQYSAQLPFTRVEQWNNTGYCFHSDHALGYFVNFYHLAVPTESLVGPLDDMLRVRNSYEYLAGNVSECKHKKEKCTVESRLCHYVTPEQMERLSREQKEQTK